MWVCMPQCVLGNQSTHNFTGFCSFLPSLCEMDLRSPGWCVITHGDG